MTTTRSNINYDELVREDATSFRVHGNVYTDPAIFEAEIDRIFHQGWVYVGHDSEIPESGDYRLTAIGRQSVIMSRDENGGVQLLMNRCRHRANAVCQYESGNAHFFRCSYHGWTYKNDGELVGVTYADAYTDDNFNREDMSLTHVPRMAIYRGFIWGSLSPNGISLDEHIGDPAKRQLDYFCDLSPTGQIIARSGSHKYGYKANWKFQMENTMDGYHGNFTHKSQSDVRRWRAGQKPVVTDYNEVTGWCADLGLGHTMLSTQTNRPNYNAGAPEPEWRKGYVQAMEESYGPERAQEIIALGGTHMGIFPNLVVMASQIRVIKPVSLDDTEVTLYPVLLDSVPPELNERRLRGHEQQFGSAGGNPPDDLEMFERNQVGLSAQVNPWLVLSRGMHRERRREDGTLVGERSDEVTQRGIFRHWKKVMSE